MAVSSWPEAVMPRFPRLKAHLWLEVVRPDLTVVLSDTGSTVFEGRIVPLLAPYLDGRHSTTDMAKVLSGQATVLDIEFGLSLLVDEDCLAPDDGAPLPPDLGPGETTERSTYLESLGLSAAETAERLASWTITVRALGGLDPDPWRQSLLDLGVRVADAGETLLVLTRDPRAKTLSAIHHDQLAEGKPWLLVRPIGREVWIGPLFRPPVTGCWSCFARRLAQNQPRHDFVSTTFEDGGGIDRVTRPTLPSSLALARHAVALQVLRWLAGDGRHLEDHLLILDTATLVGQRHRVLRRPACPDCSPSTACPEPNPIELRPVPLDSFVDGGYRTVRPAETLGRLAHHISPRTGFVGRLEEANTDPFPRADGARPPVSGRGKIHVVFADHVFPSRDPREALVSGQRRRSAGKGLSAEQAHASALCESLERISGVFRDDEPRIRGRFVDLRDRAIHPARCLLYSERQYHERERWNQGSPGYGWVPRPFDESREIEWSPLWSLSEKRWRYLPTAYCYFDVPQPREQRFCRGDSNGNAAGNTLEEAILQGFLEVVERDAVAIWWYNRLRRPRVSVASFGRTEHLELLRLYDDLGRHLHVFDVTHDLGILTLAAVSWAKEGPPRPLLGFGAHLEAEVALGRALTEMNQFLPGLFAGRDRAILSRSDVDLAYRLPDPGTTLRQKSDFPTPAFSDLRQAVTHCVEAARRRGLETLVLDQTRADIGFPVVKVVVPGLRHDWPRFAPGRLYDVPIALGWLDQPRAEHELEPAHIMI